MMTQKKNFYVYEHYRSDKKCIFYVGKGHGKRAWNFYNRNDRHKSVRKKLDGMGAKILVRIVKDGMYEPCSFTLEKILIHLRDASSLINLSKGGDGPCGIKPSKEKIEKLRETWRRKLNAPLACDRKEERKARLENKKNDCSERVNKKVFFCLNDGKKFYKVKDAADLYGLCASDVSKVLRGIQRSTKGFVFSKEVDKVIEVRKITKRPVFCVSNGLSYPSVKEAARKTGVSDKAIRKILAGVQKTTKGLSFTEQSAKEIL